MQPVISLQQISKRFGSQVALKDVSLEIPPGVVFAILGENGAGKTTLIRILTGFLKADHGSATVLGHSSESNAMEIRRSIGYVSDAPALYDWMTVEEIGWFTAAFYDDEFPTRYLELLNGFDVPTATRIKNLSKGQRAKVALALATAHDPELLILDEPTSGLDPMVRRSFLESMVDRAAQGRTVLLSSHQINEVERVADWIAIIHQGELKLIQPLDALRKTTSIVTLSLNDSNATAVLPPGEVLTETQNGRQLRWVMRNLPDDWQHTYESDAGITEVSATPASLEEIFVAVCDPREAAGDGGFARERSGTTKTNGDSMMSTQRFDNSAIMRRLLWKDIQMIKPLVIAIAAGVIAFNLLAIVLRQMYWQDGNPVIDYLFWILMPNLIALGAPAMLVGTEQESGTLDWMRTLPVSWSKITLSKFVTAIGATLLIWILASAVLWLMASLRGPTSHPFDADIASTDGVLYLLFFSFVLLFCGFITSFLLRSPVAALIIVVPMVFAVTWFCIRTARVIKSGGNWDYSYPIRNPSSTAWMTVVILAVAAIGLLAVVASWFARRRFTTPAHSRPLPFTGSATSGAYRPPRFTSMMRPSPVKAMLWQQRRQTAVYGLAILAVNVFFALIYGLADSWSEWKSPLAEFAPLVMGLSFGWLGCIAFYEDGMRRQCGYFADRGVSPTQVWWTRLFPVLPFVIALVGLWWWASWQRGHAERYELMLIVMLVMFAAGQMVAMWLRRPTLSFFASPAYALLLSGVYLTFLFPIYHSYFWTLLLVVAVLLFATWRLTPRWLDGRIDTGFHWRAVGYSLFAILLPCFVIFGDRWLTTPAAMPQWRSQMTAQRNEVLGADQSAIEIMPQARYLGRNWHPAAFGVENPDLRQALESELKELESGVTHRIGAFANASEIYGYLEFRGEDGMGYDDPLRVDTPLLAIQVLLQWARIIRTDCAAGEQSLHPLYSVAEPAERIAVNYLTRLRLNEDVPKNMPELIRLIPDAKLRQQSRERALILEWHRFNKEVARHKLDSQSGERVYFGSIPVIADSAFPFEKTRALRYLDLAVQETLEYLDSTPLPKSPRELNRLRSLWQQALAGPATAGADYYGFDEFSFMLALEHWTNNDEAEIEWLREAFPAGTSAK